jgi:hypothetical protein
MLVFRKNFSIFPTVNIAGFKKLLAVFGLFIADTS